MVPKKHEIYKHLLKNRIYNDNDTDKAIPLDQLIF